jgi:hypothetical protein
MPRLKLVEVKLSDLCRKGRESKAARDARRADDRRHEEARRRAADEVAGVEPGHPEF